MKIGVEESLSNVTQALQDKGFEVIALKNESDFNNCDCCVVTGMDSNIMGIQTTTTDVPIIEASGRSANEVVEEIEKKLQ